jgi:hypothetical protein
LRPSSLSIGDPRQIIQRVCYDGDLKTIKVPAVSLILRLAALAIIAFVQAAPALAQKPDEVLRNHAYAGTLTRGETELASLASQGGSDARFALGAAEFMRAVERLGQAFYRHGLESPRSALIPILRLPVPTNPSPEPLSYDRFRSVLAQFADDLRRADATLAQVGGEDVKLTIDVTRMRLDFDGDESGGEHESLVNVLAGIDPRFGANRSRQSDVLQPGFAVAFDRGDVAWMRGYANLLAAIAEFWIAHDFEPMFDQTFHLFFPRAGLPYAARLGEVKRSAPGIASEGGPIADAIAFVHLLNWPVREPARLTAALSHLRAVPALSHESWRYILAETDDDNEWIPNPRQTNRFPLPVTQDRIDAWLRTMAQFEEVLDGRKLVPHWRFDKGVNLKWALTEHKAFDLVLWLTGTGVVPFVEDGSILSAAEWDEITRVLGGNFFGYALWFN